MITAELKEFLEYKGMDSDFGDMKKEWAERKSESDFYQQTKFYLYDLTQFEMQEGRIQWMQRIKHYIKDKAWKIVCDFGSGIGGDAINAIEAGAEKVYMVDYDGITSEYARWRLKKRGIEGKTVFINLGEDGQPESELPEVVDCLISIASLEHSPDPAKSLEWIKRNTKYALMRPDPSNEDAHPMHHKEHFDYLYGLLKARDGESVLGFKKLNGDWGLPLFEVEG